jgi:CheY-like chemotaxis protein
MSSYHQKSFLIVDDFSDFRSSVRSMLRELGVKDVDTADTGEQALKMCSQKSYDFILQDFHLGDGKKNGQQVLEDLMSEKLISHEAVFVMVTAETSQAMVLSALEHEPDAYLTKPFNRSGLASVLSVWSNARRCLNRFCKPLIAVSRSRCSMPVLPCANRTSAIRRCACVTAPMRCAT